MPQTSVELRVFLNAPDANVDTPIQNNPNFAGAIGLFGMTSGDRSQQEKSAAGAVAPRAHPAGTGQPTTRHNHDHDHGEGHGHGGTAEGDERFDLELEMAPVLKRAANKSAEVTLKIVAVDVHGRLVFPENIPLEGIDVLID